MAGVLCQERRQVEAAALALRAQCVKALHSLDKDRADMIRSHRLRDRPRLLPYRRFLEAAGDTHLEYAVHLSDCEPEPLRSFNDLYRLGRDEAGKHGYGTLLGEYRRQPDCCPARFRTLSWWSRLAGMISV